MNAYITRLCRNVIHLLELGAKMVADRTSLVEKCLIFYNLLLNIKFAGNCMHGNSFDNALHNIVVQRHIWCYKVATGSHQNLNQDPWIEPPVFYHSMTTITTSPQNSVHTLHRCMLLMPRLHTQHHYVVVMPCGCLVVYRSMVEHCTMGSISRFSLLFHHLTCLYFQMFYMSIMSMIK